MTFRKLFSIISLITFIFTGCNNENDFKNPKDLISFSQEFLLQQKSGNETVAFIDTLKNLDNTKLITSLNSDEKKIAFWLNCYNALVQYKLSKDSTLYKNKKAFFAGQSITIGGEKMSLNSIENGILRLQTESKNESLFKQLRPTKLDYRTHFALNCGANSCPPIAFYDTNNLDQQLSLAEKSFVKSTSSYDTAKNEVEISELFKWYEEDFNGELGIIQLLKRNQIIPIWVNPKIKYSHYDWELEQNNFSK
jgi:hypothetical protein